MPTTTTKWVEAREAFVWVQGARPPEYRTAIMRDRHSGQLAEVALTELPPLDPGVTGIPHAFKRGEKIPADHPAAVAKPGYFIAVEE